MKKFLKTIILGIVVMLIGAVAAAYYLGILDWQTTKTKVRVGASQATAELGNAIENLEAPAKTVDPDKAAEECRANLRRIEAAKRVAASKLSISVGAVPRDAIVKELGGEMPTCPARGTYELGTLEITARCSVAANSMTDPHDDHIISGF